MARPWPADPTCKAATAPGAPQSKSSRTASLLRPSPPPCALPGRASQIQPPPAPVNTPLPPARRRTSATRRCTRCRPASSLCCSPSHLQLLCFCRLLGSREWCSGLVNYQLEISAKLSISPRIDVQVSSLECSPNDIRGILVFFPLIYKTLVTFNLKNQTGVIKILSPFLVTLL